MGPVITNLTWTKPNFYSVKAIFEYLDRETNLYSKYKIYIYGNVLNTWETKDLDVLINPIGNFNYLELEKDICLIADTCLNKFRILPDIQFMDITFPKNIIRSIKNKSIIYYKSEEDLKIISRIKFNYFKKISDYDNFEITQNGFKVSENLVKIESIVEQIIKGDIPGKSIYNISLSDYKNHEKVVYYLDSREIIGSSVEDFDKKTNRFNI
jgi:hypothetical protein